MAQTKLGESVVNTSGELPAIGSMAPPFILTGKDLKNVNSETFGGKNIVLNIFPSVDTSTCATSVREFNKRIAAFPNSVVLCISKDLPFALRRFCGTEGIENAITLTDFRNMGFGKNYGVDLIDGGFSGLFARAVVVIDSSGKVKHTQLVAQIGEEPDYDSALKSL